ncbi:growth arrest and DNA damage-inducible proteins-interacting protein 1 [Neodiprion fabricii]|uniref:growth arrest and DNA damage-inducible proteins-interacting protein 1 n=1 Tax=Neodiprion fabricii TaxID=2872261 RepID=UPI001ED94F1B|nr:growth arrest and DNA damage-inducible proteins-interacting protein 1 [Neodiprion fabricii]
MNVMLSRNGCVASLLPRIFSRRFAATNADEVSNKDDLDIETLNEQFDLPEGTQGLTEEEIEQKRNKSRLNAPHRNILFDKCPQYDPIQSFHTSVKYKQRIVGRYGIEASNVPIGIAWPTKEEVADRKEYESVLYPETIYEMWDKIAKKNVELAESIRARDEAVAQNVMKLDKWTADLNAKIAKKEAEIAAARERKERLIEEVRRHFGYKIHPNDERFKEMLAQKDKEDRKQKKLAKKQAKEQQLMAKLAKKNKEEKTKGNKRQDNEVNEDAE